MKVFDLELYTNHYYIKKNTILDKIKFNNRTFYSKFKYIDEPLTPLLLQQHLSKQYTIAIPLLKNGYTDYLVLEYKGEEYKRFYHLTKHLFKTIKIDNYYIYEGRSEDTIQIFIYVNHFSIEEAEKKLKIYSDALEKKMVKRWKTLPSSKLPLSYNIITLPYKKI